jgi:hypothetical protein
VILTITAFPGQPERVKETNMNYIKQLEQERTDLQHVVITRAERVQEFRQHLLTSKFHAVQQDGSRGDLVSVADVFNWLRYVEDTTLENV